MDKLIDLFDGVCGFLMRCRCLCRLSGFMLVVEQKVLGERRLGFGGVSSIVGKELKAT